MFLLNQCFLSPAMEMSAQLSNQSQTSALAHNSSTLSNLKLNLTTKINLNIGHQQLDAMIRTQHFLISTLDRKKCFPSKAINEIHLTIVTLYRRGVKLKLVPIRVVESIQDLILG